MKHATSILPSLVALGAMLTLAACEPTPREVTLGASARAPVPAQAGAPSGTLPRLVFFKNPNGAPCQYQQRILDGLGPQLSGKVELVVYNTTSAADLSAFDAFGVQGLPSLVLTDPRGRELRRTPAGIVGPQQVLALVDGQATP